jgi:hypothetical protein
MPAGNRMGPRNMGPRTGRGMGYCAGYDQPGYSNMGSGFMGAGRGAFGGHGNRNWFHATGMTGWERGMRGYYPPTHTRMSEEEEQGILREQEKWLEEQLNDIRSRLKKDVEE